MEQIRKYGVEWPKGVTDFQIELALYANENTRAQTPKVRTKWEHFRTAIKMYLPDSVFSWHRWVDDAGEVWCEETEGVIWGAGGTTKSGIIGAFSLFDLMAAPKTTLTVMVTNPQEKHWDRCFSKTLLWRNSLPKHLQIGKLVRSPKPALSTMDAAEGSRRGILCISIDDGESGQEIARKVGAHAPRTRLILEEGQTLPAATLDIATNLFMGSRDRKEFIIGNPMTWNNNALGDASIPMSGDTSRIDKEKPDRWELKRTHGETPGVCLVFDGLKCPALDSPEEAKRLHFMIGEKDIKTALDRPGAENTINFWSQIRGRIPAAGMVVTVFNDLDWRVINVSQTHKWVDSYEQWTSADLSLGGDKIPVYLWGVGQAQNRGKLAQKIDVEYITVNTSLEDRSGQIGEAYVKILKKWGIMSLKNCSADCSGQQGAIADTMERMCKKAGISGYIYRVRSEEGVTERVLSNTSKVMRSKKGEPSIRERACDRYKDRATELVMNVVECIQAGVIWGMDDNVRKQLCSREYDEDSLDGGKTKVQKKKEWIEANKGQSPDELDSTAVFCAHVLETRSIVPGRDTLPKTEEKSSLPKWMQKGGKPIYIPRSSEISTALSQR